MPRKFFVTRVWLVEAEDEEAAIVEATGSPDRVRTTRADRPPLVGYAELYEQPTEVLDLAWDKYRERDLWSHEAPPEERVPSSQDLAQADVSPPKLAMLFDVAITAYREHVEGDGGSDEMVLPD